MFNAVGFVNNSAVMHIVMAPRPGQRILIWGIGLHGNGVAMDVTIYNVDAAGNIINAMSVPRAVAANGTRLDNYTGVPVAGSPGEGIGLLGTAAGGYDYAIRGEITADTSPE